MGNPNPKHKFKKGHKLGGARKGAGRPPTWFVDKCKEIIDRRELIEWVADVAAGEITDYSLNMSGKPVPLPARAAVRLEAVRFLTERGYGKPNQAVEHSVDETKGFKRFAIVIETKSNG